MKSTIYHYNPKPKKMALTHMKIFEMISAEVEDRKEDEGLDYDYQEDEDDIVHDVMLTIGEEPTLPDEERKKMLDEILEIYDEDYISEEYKKKTTIQFIDAYIHEMIQADAFSTDNC
jgi:hypothetical protein